MVLALLLHLACLLPEIAPEQRTREVHQRLNSTVLLLGFNQNISSAFNMEWRVQLKEREQNTISIVTYSPSSQDLYVNKRYKHRVNFSQTNFSLEIYHVNFSDEGVYTLNIQFNNSTQALMKTRVTVITPVSSVHVTSTAPIRYWGNNVTLNCSVTAGSSLSYSWEKCNQPLPSRDRTVLSQDNASLTLLNLQPSDIGNYRCVVRNALSSGHKDFPLLLCEETDASPWLSYGLYGYPGYLGYAVLLFCIVRWLRKTKKSCHKRKSDVIYENTNYENRPKTSRLKVSPTYVSYVKE